MTSLRFLIFPGWANSGEDHWQSLWERRLGCQAERIEQRDWDTPLPQEWEPTARETIARQRGPVVLVAHSLGCIVSAKILAEPLAPVVGAILVAPADVERRGVPEEIAIFAPISRGPLAVPSLVIASSSDSFCRPERAAALAFGWRADYWNIGDAGHINAAAGYGEWPEGWSYVMKWLGEHVEG